ncbi:MAG: methylated-DNA--[protein]-cysteine S-methyltransferase [Gammaproteobacteria bacterium]|nr:methylated-DNA--[protein]-cysteine S-methyltransferase [Gammaproteobacteria bacterium]
MKKINIQHHQTPVGELILGSFNTKLCLADFNNRKARLSIDKRIQHKLNAQYIEKPSDAIESFIFQLDEFFNGVRQTFDIDLLMAGTAFQQNVWNTLLKIPYGETRSYRQLAQSLSKEKAVRAVANANAANALSIIIPCHRVISSNGQLTGYAGGLDAKKYLLNLEQSK